MYSQTCLLRLFQYLFFFALFQLSTCIQCYYPDGSESQDTPCSNGTNSACCSAAAYCLSNNLCITGMILSRGSCTDQTFKASECPSYCLDIDTDGGKGMAPCSSDLYTCDYDTCYQSNFSLPSASIVLRSDQIAALSLATTVTTTATAASVTITSAMTMTSSTRATCSSSQQGDPGDTHLAYSNSTNSSKLAAVGAGVGIPLAVAALVALALLLQEKRRSRRLKRENQQLAERRHYELKALNGKYGPQYYSTQELMGQEPHELEQDVTYELGH